VTQEPVPPEGHLRPTTGASLAIAAVVGLVVGWLLRPVMVRINGTAPYVTWVQALALVFVAAALAYVAWHTWQTIQVRRQRLPDNRAVNRLVLARASALVGALAAGGYAGYGVTWLGDASELADERLLRCGVAAVGGVLMMLASLVLERACRVPSEDPGP
jgi:small-conductance mechanosensitive channel